MIRLLPLPELTRVSNSVRAHQLSALKIPLASSPAGDRVQPEQRPRPFAEPFRNPPTRGDRVAPASRWPAKLSRL